MLIVLPILYSYRRCPYAMRARMALKHADISVEILEIVLKDKPVEIFMSLRILKLPSLQKAKKMGDIPAPYRMGSWQRTRANRSRKNWGRQNGAMKNLITIL